MTTRIYLWDLMDEIWDDIRPLGLRLSYSSPSLSKEEFEQSLSNVSEDPRTVLARLRRKGIQEQFEA
jgi:hypothetical protein